MYLTAFSSVVFPGFYTLTSFGNEISDFIWFIIHECKIHISEKVTCQQISKASFLSCWKFPLILRGFLRCYMLCFIVNLLTILMSLPSNKDFSQNFNLNGICMIKKLMAAGY